MHAISKIAARRRLGDAFYRRKRSSDPAGFTIIEVLIVLAIASIMILIIFFVVPEAQRNQRNHSRKHTMELVGAALEEYNMHYGDYPRTNAQRTQFRNTTPEMTKYHDLQFRPNMGSHEHYPPMDTVAIQFGHWCNRYGNGSQATDPIAGTDTSTSLYAIWTLLEPDHPDDPTRRFYACIDNYDYSTH